jgi:hypothetical protein
MDSQAHVPPPKPNAMIDPGVPQMITDNVTTI